MKFHNTIVRTTLGRRFAATAALAITITLTPLVHAQGGQGTGAGAGMDAQVLTGGVGEGERAKLAEQAKGHNLKLVFVMSTGSYIAEVPFQIQRGGKTVVEETSKGPWAFAKLPPGNYTVKATYEGKTQTRQVSVPKTGQKRLSLTWPASERVAEQPQPR